MGVDVDGFVRYWGFVYWIDVWFRREYKLRFGCDEHLSTRLADMRFAYIEHMEDKLYEWRANIERGIKDITGDKITNVADYLKEYGEGAEQRKRVKHDAVLAAYMAHKRKKKEV